MEHGFATERLTAEPLSEAHFDDLCRMHGDPAVMATLAGVRSPDWNRQLIAAQAEHWRHYGFGLYVWRDKAEGRFAGRAGLKHSQVEGRDRVELAYGLMPDFWGRGHATEIARACTARGFEIHGLTELVCFTLTTNLASQRVMEKAGFRRQYPFTHADLPHVLYRITAEDWAAA